MTEPSNMENGEALKEKRIQTAVHFLQNPKVRNTPLERKRAFLEKKGLSKEEVDRAVELSGAEADEVAQLQSLQQARPAGPQPGILTTEVPAISPKGLWKDYLLVAFLGGTLGYGLVHLFRTYILPWLFRSEQEDPQLQRINQSVQELRDNMMQTVGDVQITVTTLQQNLEENQNLIKTLSTDLATTKNKLTLITSENCTLSDLKAELTSLKGLLLGRRQFPPPSLPPSPAIPAWQRSPAATRAGPALGDSVPPADEGASGPSHCTPAQSTPRSEEVRQQTVSEPSPLVNGHSEVHLVNGTQEHDTDTSSDDTSDTVTENIQAPDSSTQQRPGGSAVGGNEGSDDTLLRREQNSFTALLSEMSENFDDDASVHLSPSDTSLSSMSSDFSSVNLSAETNN